MYLTNGYLCGSATKWAGTCGHLKQAQTVAASQVCARDVVSTFYRTPRGTGLRVQEMINKIKCFFGFHKWDTDRHLTNGARWRFCRHCGLRQIGEYDMMYGTTDWRNY